MKPCSEVMIAFDALALNAGRPALSERFDLIQRGHRRIAGERG